MEFFFCNLISFFNLFQIVFIVRIGFFFKLISMDSDFVGKVICFVINMLIMAL